MGDGGTRIDRRLEKVKISYDTFDVSYFVDLFVTLLGS